MKKTHNILLLLAFFYCFSYSITATAAYVTISDAEQGYKTGDEFHFNINLESLDLDASNPLPCTSGCLVGISVNDHGGYYGASLTGYASAKVKGSTVGEVETAFLKAIGGSLPYTQKVTGYWSGNYISWFNPPGACATLTYTTEVGGIIADWNTLNVSGKVIPLPGTNCGAMPVTNTHCNVSNSIEIDHGTLGPESIEGNEKKSTLTINCDKKTDVSLVLNENSLDLGGGITSELNISQDKVTVNNTANVEIDSKLHSSGKPSSGKYTNNSAVLYLDWY